MAKREMGAAKVKEFHREGGELYSVYIRTSGHPQGD